MLRNQANCKAGDGSPEGPPGVAQHPESRTLPWLIAVAQRRIEPCEAEKDHIQRGSETAPGGPSFRMSRHQSCSRAGAGEDGAPVCSSPSLPSFPLLARPPSGIASAFGVTAMGLWRERSGMSDRHRIG